jgi:hypothetical protein
MLEKKTKKRKRRRRTFKSVRIELLIVSLHNYLKHKIIETKDESELTLL